MARSVDPASARGPRRRELLKAAGAAPVLLAAARLAAAEPSAAGPASPRAAPRPMPQITIGKHAFSRLICGSNCFQAGSHLSVFVNNEMRRYYTPEQVLKTLRRCEDSGINTWQSGHGYFDLYRRYVDEGGKLQFLSLESNTPAVVETLARGGCLGIAHHGEVTDTLFKAGRIDQVHEFLKRVRDAGVLAGVSTHMPDVVDAIESKGWDLDYYMTCVYERHRSEADLQKLLGHVPLPVGEVYLKSDPPRMFKAIRQTRRPCLAFKILAAGRLAERRGWVEQAFQDTLAAIKPNDGLIVGIYDRYADQAAEDAALVRRFG
jgi:hypothetical protein